MATELSNFSEILPPGMHGVRLTTVATTDTYESPFADTVIAIGTNETDDDGVGIAVETVPAAGRTQTITITVGTVGDVVALLIVGRK